MGIIFERIDPLMPTHVDVVTKNDVPEKSQNSVPERRWCSETIGGKKQQVRQRSVAPAKGGARWQLQRGSQAASAPAVHAIRK